MTDVAVAVDDFIRKCKMLRRKKEEEENNDKTKTFKIYSDLNIPSNKWYAIDSFFSNKNRLNNKYYQEKQSLIKCFNREERFINYNKLIKQSYIGETPDSLQTQTKDKYSSYYLDLIFSKRDEEEFEQIDKFFDKYNISSLKLKNEESDFYGKIYSILCKNNYMKFLSYLYSKNDIFKFIYDEFSDKDAVENNFSLDSSLASHVQYKLEGKNLNQNQNQSSMAISDSFSDNKIRQKELGIGPDNLKKDNKNVDINIKAEISDDEKNEEKTKKNEILEQIANSYIYIKIGFLNKIIKENLIVEFFQDFNEISSSEDNSEEEKEKNKENEDKKSKKEQKFIKLLTECSSNPIDNILLINSGKKLKIIDNKYNTILENKMSKIIISKISKDTIKKTQVDFVKVDYYLLQIKKQGKKEYYLFKIAHKNVSAFDHQTKENFDMVKIKDFISHLKQDKTNKKNQKKEKKSKKEKRKSDKEKIILKQEENKENKNEEEAKDMGQTPSDFTPKIESFSSEAHRTSILKDENEEDSNDPALAKIEKVMLDSNAKKTSKFQSEHKNYDFIIDNEKLSFDIIKGELRCKQNNKQMKKFQLNEISPQKVEEDKEHSCYKLEIKKGKNIAFRIINQDKTTLENFYNDLIEAKKICGY